MCSEKIRKSLFFLLCFPFGLGWYLDRLAPRLCLWIALRSCLLLSGKYLDLGGRAGLVAVVDSDIAYGVHFGVPIQPGNLSGIVGIGERRVTGATIWVDDHEELEVCIGLDTEGIISLVCFVDSTSHRWHFWSFFLFFFSLVFFSRLSRVWGIEFDLRCIEWGPGFRVQWIDVGHQC